MIRLDHIGHGVKVLVSGINAGRQAQQKMATLGIFPGAMLQVLSGNRHGPVVIRIGSGKLILGRTLASKIMVKQ
ncbi:MAG: ferrous iron transport protein A [Deltaproteobacteria bacterium]|nr:ferrous iron transport protein A [Candidatus Anaeroferrophillus wilburensis]MBN2889406.1 ferrous iron transport protein A [Deltaproteobacteria bacterium]